MNGKLRPLLGGMTVLLLIVLGTLPSLGGSRGAVAGTTTFPPDALRRFAANFTAFGFEVVTDADPLPQAQGGLTIYDKDFFFTIPPANVVYVTVSGTADAHGGQALALACLFDDNPCNPRSNPVGFAPTGWINLMNEPIGDSCDHGGGGGGDCHDNGVYYQWCYAVSLNESRVHNVKVRLASLDTPTSDGVSPVFMEALHFYIDANYIKGRDRCTVSGPDGGVAPPQANGTP